MVFVVLWYITLGVMDMNLMRYFEQNKKLLIKVIAGIILLAIAFAFYLMKENTEDQDMTVSLIPDDGMENSEPSTGPAIEEEIMIMVDIAGAVANPAVVELPEGSRIFEAIEKAGGLTKEADLRGTNQAEILTDGQKVYIPTVQELKESQSGAPSLNFTDQSGTSQSKRININTADSETLQQLTGVGPATAEKIINYRNENGKFKSIEDIKNVSGIGDKTFEKFRDKITV